MLAVSGLSISLTFLVRNFLNPIPLVLCSTRRLVFLQTLPSEQWIGGAVPVKGATLLRRAFTTAKGFCRQYNITPSIPNRRVPSLSETRTYLLAYTSRDRGPKTAEFRRSCDGGYRTHAATAARKPLRDPIMGPRRLGCRSRSRVYIIVFYRPRPFITRPRRRRLPKQKAPLKDSACANVSAIHIRTSSLSATSRFHQKTVPTIEVRRGADETYNDRN